LLESPQLSLSISFFINVAESSFKPFLELSIVGEHYLGLIVLIIEIMHLVVPHEGFKPIKRGSGEICGNEQDLVGFVDEFFVVHLHVHVHLRQERSQLGTCPIKWFQWSDLDRFDCKSTFQSLNVLLELLDHTHQAFSCDLRLRGLLQSRSANIRAGGGWRTSSHDV
jgi:hypothetical protein